MSTIRSYHELRELQTFDERFQYLKLDAYVGAPTFGFDRWVNQRFYKSYEWKHVRDYVIGRDYGCDLGILGYEIYSDLLVHHMNPLTLNDLDKGEEHIIDPDFLITTSLTTHNAIHYGDESLLPRGPIKRERGDTKLW